MDLNDCRNVAMITMAEHGLDTPSGWRFKFDSSVKRFGLCNHTTKEISLSRHLVEINTQQEIMLTLLHEIAHALTPGHGHDAVWESKAKEIGGSYSRCYNTPGTGRDVKTLKAPYIGTCADTAESLLRCTQAVLSWPVFRRKKLRCGLCKSPIVYKPNNGGC